mmetsp:Transcript_11763/g.22890  ORF Transcript_11763/g.22890 Transcript_11763/m.22890 type:complete len:112 (+) Transcript_11763:282-617(+)
MRIACEKSSLLLSDAVNVFHELCNLLIKSLFRLFLELVEFGLIVPVLSHDNSSWNHLSGSRSEGRSRGDSSEDEDGLVHGGGVECWSKPGTMTVVYISSGIFPSGRPVQRK